MQQRKTRIYGRLALAGAICSIPVFAGFTGGGVMGADLTGPQSTALDGAISDIGDAECQAGLGDMQDSGRICQGTNIGGGAATVPDDSTGSGGDRMAVGPGLLGGDATELKCVMVHEWTHVGQPIPSGMTRAEAEKEAFKAQKDCLEGEGVTSGGTYEWCCTMVDFLCKVTGTDTVTGTGTVANAATGKNAAAVAPIFGYRQLSFNGPSYYGVHQFSSELHHYMQGQSMSYFSMNLATPYNLIDLEVKGPNGGTILAACGVDFSGNGSIEYIEADTPNGTVLGGLGSVSLPGLTALDIAYERAGGVDHMFVLDVAAGKVRTILDTDGDRLPDLLLPQVFVNAPNALSIVGSQEMGSGHARGVHLIAADLRYSDNLPALEAPANLHVDTNGDYQADIAAIVEGGNYYDLFPIPYPNPGFDDPDLTVQGTRGHKVQLWTSDRNGTRLQFVTEKIIPFNSNTTVFSPGAPFVTGDWYVLVDTSTPNAKLHPFQVRSTKEYGTACSGAISPQPPRAWFSGGDSIGTISEWNLASDSPLVAATFDLSLSQADVDLTSVGAPGCSLYIGPSVINVGTTTDAFGNATALIGIPNNPNLIGLEVFGQWGVADPGNALGVITTNGLGLEIQL